MTDPMHQPGPPALPAPFSQPFSAASPLAVPPAKKPKKSRPVLVGAISGAVGLVIGIGIGGAGGGEADSGKVTASASAAATTSGTEEVAEQDAAATVEPTPEPVATTPAPAEGTRANPFAIGEAVGNEDWSVVLSAPREAGAEVSAENQFNSPPAAGFEFYIVPVSATYTGAETGTAWLDLQVAFVGSDGVTYSDSCGVIPESLNDVGELYAGGVAAGNACVAVPAGADGLWTVSAGWSDPVFFTTTPA
ncbi:hypothetical protein SAMN05216410_1792 [Sanguibacter gelidistatuariae]|uniref:Uncharacterized protein n=1 Tax=Sanguibacter gelidistatuariae TaxID=1814289 RepID=A0A1G6L8R5_9MICO|nr:hypothetical protein [Sanguibacter gelidistatuariae]SDC39548.1 hypothetical protein SAMN05216410_1792 [Sanguibacter gelidistatuariae]